jgi:hypothetical protein
VNIQRRKELETVGGLPTQEEHDQGWHYCQDWDQLLVGPGMPAELSCCTCAQVHSDGTVFKPGETQEVKKWEAKEWKRLADKEHHLNTAVKRKKLRSETVACEFNTLEKSGGTLPAGAFTVMVFKGRSLQQAVSFHDDAAMNAAKQCYTRDGRLWNKCVGDGAWVLPAGKGRIAKSLLENHEKIHSPIRRRTTRRACGVDGVEKARDALGNSTLPIT